MTTHHSQSESANITPSRVYFPHEQLATFDDLYSRVYLVSDLGRILWRNAYARSHDPEWPQTTADDAALASFAPNSCEGSEPFVGQPSQLEGGSFEAHAPFLAMPVRIDLEWDRPGRPIDAHILIVNKVEPPTPTHKVHQAESSEMKKVLTPMEWRLVTRLSAGKTLKSAAADMGISYHTARKYLQTVFTKVGVKRQVDLILKLEAA